MSKKLAEGIDALVLDVKTGRALSCKPHDRSMELAKTLRRYWYWIRKETIGFITNMNQPLGVAIGQLVRKCRSCWMLTRGNRKK